MDMRKEKKRKKIFEHWMFNSLIRSSNIKTEEMILGYLIGPLGALILNATLTSYLNLYYTDVLGLAAKEYGMFLGIFPMISTAFIIGSNIMTGLVIDRTITQQGKARPFLLLAAPLLAIACFFLFAVPDGSVLLKSIWVFLSYNLYYSVAYAIYLMSHSLMVPLSTRNSKQRSLLSVVTNIANMGAAGLFAAILFPMLFLPYLGVDQRKWMFIMSILSLVALAAVLVEYYFTVERITKSSINLTDAKEKIPIQQQLKAIVTDFYWWLIILYYLIYQGGACFKNNTFVYFCNYIAGKYNDGYTQTTLAFLGGIPLAAGMLCIWFLADKFGKKNVLMAGFFLSMLGGMICMIAPENFIMVVIGQAIKGIGGIPGVYIMMALFAEVLDHLEYKNGFRCDGLSMSLYSSIMVAMNGLCMGIFNLMLSKAGYIAPAEAIGQTIVAVQNQSTKQVFIWGYIGIEVIGHGLLAILLFFLNVEKNIEHEQTIILERQKERSNYDT